MVQSKSYSLLIILLFSIWSCKPDEPEPDDPPVITGSEVIISSEGNFGWGDGSINLYDPESKRLEEDVYAKVNGNSPGNVLQSICFHGSEIFLVMNNSKKIIVTDSQFQKTGEITGFSSPRYVYPVTQNKAYVSDLYADKIWIVDLSSYAISGSINTQTWTEDGLINGDEFWVSAPKEHKVYIIDIATDQLIDSIAVPYQPGPLVRANNGAVWLLSEGDGIDKKAKLSVLKTLPRSLEWSKEIGDYVIDLCYDSTQNSLLWYADGLYQMQADTNATSKFLQSFQLYNAYAIDVDAKSSEIYISDALDYTQKSRILRLNSEGILLDEFYTGIISSNFYFK